jgi:5'-phosphate synthase pdxT subunit
MARSSTVPNLIGVLDLQGGVWEHLDHFERIGLKAAPVKDAAVFPELAGLVIPGGESTCLSRLIRIFDLENPIIDACRRGTRLWGTCAGAILLARSLKGEEPHLGLIDIELERNSFGSQLDSFVREALVPKVAPDPLPLTFIRAPKIIRAGQGVEILLEMDGYIAAAETEEVLVTVFHPELTDSLAFHRYFARKCGLTLTPNDASPLRDADWCLTSWTRFNPTPHC